MLRRYISEPRNWRHSQVSFGRTLLKNARPFSPLLTSAAFTRFTELAGVPRAPSPTFLNRLVHEKYMIPSEGGLPA